MVPNYFDTSDCWTGVPLTVCVLPKKKIKRGNLEKIKRGKQQPNVAKSGLLKLPIRQKPGCHWWKV